MRNTGNLQRITGGILLFLFLGSLSACFSEAVVTPTDNIEDTQRLVTVAAPETVTPSPIPSATAQPSAVATVSLTPTQQEPTPENFSLPPLPPSIAIDVLFHDDPSCQLPCWQGLRVGESHRSDIQYVFDTAFEFNGQDVFSLTDPSEAPRSPSGLELVNLVWTSDPNYDRFNLRLYVEEDTTILHSISLTWIPNSIEQIPTPQRVIRELGTPSYVFILVEAQQVIGAFLKMNIIYDEGLGFYFTGDISTELTYDENGILHAPIEFCLDEYFSDPIVDIVRPLESGFQYVSPLQRVYRYVDEESLPFQEVFPITLQELTNLALYEENYCFQADISDFQKE